MAETQIYSGWSLEMRPEGQGEAKGTSWSGRSWAPPPPHTHTPRPGEPGQPSEGCSPARGGWEGTSTGSGGRRPWGRRRTCSHPACDAEKGGAEKRLCPGGQTFLGAGPARPSRAPNIPSRAPNISEHRDVGGHSPRPQPCGHTDSLAAQQAQGLLLQPSQGIRGDDGSMA